MNIIHIGAMVNGKDEGFSHALRKVATNYVEINSSLHIFVTIHSRP